MNNNSFFVTTPIYYVNDSPHIGHAYTSIACDVIARFNRLNGKKTMFLTGTDEHGLKIEQAAKKKNMDTKKFVDQMSLDFKKLTKILNLSNDFFVRTTETYHKKASQHIWKILKENNEIYLDKYKGWYSISDEAYFNDDEITTDEKTKKKIAPSGNEVQWVEEESYFFKLSKWQDKLIDYYNNNPIAICPKSRFNEVISFIKSGLKDLSISRTTFKWGVPVPNNKDHVMYVWIDALCNYITSIGYPNTENEKFKKYWPGLHVVGKDILRFHAVYWPAFLMAADLEPPKQIFAHGWWTNEGQKISKSLGNVIDPYDIINKYGLDQIRFFLFREVPFGNDGDFSKHAIEKRINSDLSNNYGNLIQRVCSFINKNCDSIVSNNFNLKNKEDNNLIDLSIEKFKKYKFFLNNYEIDKAIKEIMELITNANIYVDKQAPWTLKNKDQNRMEEVLSLLVEIIRRSSLMLFPIMPKSVENVFEILNLNTKEISFNFFDKIPLNKHQINNAYPIFPRIDYK